MIKMKKNLVLLILLSLIIGCNDRQVDKSKLYGSDYRLFYDTPAWPLAEAVEKVNTSRIEKEVLVNGINVDYQEPRSGNTLLMMSVQNSNLKAVYKLLSLDANPNLKNNYRGTSAMIYAAENDDPKYLEILLRYGGDPNALETEPVKENERGRTNAINTASSYGYIRNLEKTRLLVEAGADINYSSDSSAHTDVPLALALIHQNMDVVLYLLENGADYQKVMIKDVNGRNIFILETLRKRIFDLDSKDYQYKMKIIEFLKTKGLDYDKEPIPDFVLKDIKKRYPDSWEEYVKKY